MTDEQTRVWHSDTTTPDLHRPILVKTANGCWQVITNKLINGQTATYWMTFAGALKVKCWAYVDQIVPSEIQSLR